MHPSLRQIIEQNKRQQYSDRTETGPGAALRRPDGSYGPQQGHYYQEAIEGGRKTFQPGPIPFEKNQDRGRPLGPKMQIRPASFPGAVAPPAPLEGAPPMQPAPPADAPPKQQDPYQKPKKPEEPLDRINVPPQHFGPKFIGHRALPAKKPFAGPPALKGVPIFWSSPQGPSRYEWVAYQRLVGQGMKPKQAAYLIRSGADLPLKSPISHVAKQYPAFKQNPDGTWAENRPLNPAELPSHITGKR